MNQIERINRNALLNAKERIQSVCETINDSSFEEWQTIEELDRASIDLALATGRVSVEQHARHTAKLLRRPLKKGAMSVL